MTNPTPIDPTPIYVAHVADELQFAHGAGDYDAAADYAASLLSLYPYLVTAADAYSQGSINAAQFAAYVARAVRENDLEGGF